MVIYVLIDPVMKFIHYIGKTAVSVDARFKRHLISSQMNETGTIYRLIKAVSYRLNVGRTNPWKMLNDKLATVDGHTVRYA